MRSFTGEDLAALLDVGCLIVAEKKKSTEMQEILRHNSHIPQVRMMNHWVQGVYLITEVEVDGASDGSDCIVAVNITRQLDESDLPLEIRHAEAAKQVNKVTYHIGGPCIDPSVTTIALLHATHPDEVEANLSVSVGGNQGGLWVVGEQADVAKIAVADAERTGNPSQIKSFIGTARWSRTQLLGELARGGWGMCRAEAADAFPTEAVVNTASNSGAGEAQSGGFPKHDELWSSLVHEGCNRLIFAPENEMSKEEEDDDDQRTAEDEDHAARELNQRMAKHREQLKQQLLAQQAKSTGEGVDSSSEGKAPASEAGPPDCD